MEGKQNKIKDNIEVNQKKIKDKTQENQKTAKKDQNKAMVKINKKSINNRRRLVKSGIKESSSKTIGKSPDSQGTILKESQQVMKAEMKNVKQEMDNNVVSLSTNVGDLKVEDGELNVEEDLKSEIDD